MGKPAKSDAADRSSRAKSASPGADGFSAPPLDLSYLEGTIGYSIRRAQLAVFRDIYRAFGDAAITTAQFSILAVAANNPGVNQSDLALALGVERPRIVPLLDSLEKRGLAVRVSSASDGRHRQIHLTAQGERLLADLKQRFAAHQQRVIDALGANEARDFLRNLQLLTTHIKPDESQSR